jgi:AcrR family transcriptional regulator
MARKPVAREAVLDAFESLLIEEGERAATLDAVARLAGVSKGGLLYHFPNKEAMISVLLERLDRLLAEDLAAMAAAPEGAAAFFIKSSVWADTPLDRVFVAATRLAEVAHQETLRRMAAVQASWLELLAADVGRQQFQPTGLHRGHPAQRFLVGHFGEPGGGHEDPVQRRVRPDGGLDEERRGAFRGGSHGGEVLGEQPVQPFQQDGNHRLLVGEVVEQPALGDAGQPGHSIQRRCTFALFDEQGFERVKDGFAGDGFSGHGSNHAPRRGSVLRSVL